MRSPAAWLLALAGTWVSAQSLAFTFDDGPNLHTTPRMTALERHEALLAALKAEGVQAMFYVNARFLGEGPEGQQLLRMACEAGHLLANHTASHLDFHDGAITLEAFQADVLACDAMVRPYAGFRPFFRFPYLHEGHTAERRDAMRAFLAAKGYRPGHVGMDTSDWLIADAFQKALAADPALDLGPWRRFYLDHLRTQARAFDRLVRQVHGREVPLVVLLHHNLLNAHFLRDALEALKAEGWHFVSPETAYADPAYLAQPRIVPYADSLFEASARALGLKLSVSALGLDTEAKLRRGLEALARPRGAEVRR